MPELIEDYMSPSNTLGVFDSPNSFLFNDTNTPFSLKFVEGETYLIRIVNMAAVACGQFHIEGYTLTVVEADGVQTVPKTSIRYSSALDRVTPFLSQAKQIPLVEPTGSRK